MAPPGIGGGGDGGGVVPPEVSPPEVLLFSVQVTVMLPTLSAFAWNDPGAQTSWVTAEAGSGTTSEPEKATAAASTRLILTLRFMDMVYLEKRRRIRHCAARFLQSPRHCRTVLMTPTFSLDGIRRADGSRGRAVQFVWILRPFGEH